jgi:thymidylate kinase
VFILVLPVAEALRRLARKGKGALQVSESFPYLKQVAAIYAGLRGPRLRRVEASRPPLSVHAAILEETRRALEEAAAA